MLLLFEAPQANLISILSRLGWWNWFHLIDCLFLHKSQKAQGNHIALKLDDVSHEEEHSTNLSSKFHVHVNVVFSSTQAEPGNQEVKPSNPILCTTSHNVTPHTVVEAMFVKDYMVQLSAEIILALVPRNLSQKCFECDSLCFLTNFHGSIVS